MRAIAFALLLSASAICAPASAQVDNFVGPLSPGVWMSTFNIDPISTTLCHNGMLPDQPGCPGGGRAGAAAPRPTPAPAANPAALRFTPSPERRRTNLAHFVEKTRAADPAGAQQLQQLFASTDIITRMGTELAPVGLRIDDLADAYTVWWVNCWSAVHGDFSTADRATAMAVKAQVTRALLTQPQIMRANDAAKQEFAEALLIQALLLDASLQQAKDKPDQMQAVAAAANQGAKGMGIDMTTMRLTPQGFTPAG